MRSTLQILILLLIVLYESDEKTREIHIYDIQKEDLRIEVVCAEGVSESECYGGEKPKKEITSVSWEEIENFVIKGPYSF